MVQNEYIWDPLRRKSVKNTPEEAVRQWFISVLHEGMKVPEHMMGSEVALAHAGKQYRADIVVYGRQARPLMVVECKRPEVALDQEVVDQALRYNNELNVRYITVTNGTKTFIFERRADGWQFMQKAPLWEEMLGRAEHDENEARNDGGRAEHDENGGRNAQSEARHDENDARRAQSEAGQGGEISG